MKTNKYSEFDYETGVLHCYPAPNRLREEDVFQQFFSSPREVLPLIRQKIKEWQSVQQEIKEKLRDTAIMIAGFDDPFKRYFWTNIITVYPVSQRLEEACRQIQRLVRLERHLMAQIKGIKSSEDLAIDVAKAVPIISLIDLGTAKQSGDKYSLCCPFHEEKTPSLYIYPSTNSFYCFGCHMGGDVITFVMQLQGMSFVQAVKYLLGGQNNEYEYVCSRAGIRATC